MVINDIRYYVELIILNKYTRMLTFKGHRKMVMYTVMVKIIYKQQYF